MQPRGRDRFETAVCPASSTVARQSSPHKQDSSQLVHILVVVSSIVQVCSDTCTARGRLLMYNRQLQFFCDRLEDVSVSEVYQNHWNLGIGSAPGQTAQLLYYSQVSCHLSISEQGLNSITSYCLVTP